MTIILSHISALEFWLSPHKVQPKIVRADIPEKGPSSLERNRFLQRFANQLGTPVHTLTKTLWPSNGPFHHHSCSLFAKGLPLAVACEGVLVCPVELAFVQVATHLPFPELVRLGFELCGAYSVDRTASGGFFQRKPLTTPQRIAQFACDNASLRGSAKARRTLRYIAENAASPAETRIAMSLTLPLAEGGFGLPKGPVEPQFAAGRLRTASDWPALFCLRPVLARLQRRRRIRQRCRAHRRTAHRRRFGTPQRVVVPQYQRDNGHTRRVPKPR